MFTASRPQVEYISDTIRVTRADDGQLFVHARV
jgi:hypothetical protein